MASARSQTPFSTQALRRSRNSQFRRKFAYGVFAAGLAFWLGLALLYPLTTLGLLATATPEQSLPLGLAANFELTQLWQDPYYAQLLGATLLQATLAMALCLALAVPTALTLWLLQARHAQDTKPGKLLRWTLPCLALPFLLPVIVVALMLRNSADSLGWDLENARLLTLLWAYSFYNLGFCTWQIHTALERIPPVLLDCARNLGAGPGQVLLRVVWPNIRAAVCSSGLLTFILCGTSLGLPLLFGGSTWANAEVAIYQLANYDLDLAAASSLALVQCLFIALLLLATKPFIRTQTRSAQHFAQAPAHTQASHRKQASTRQNSVSALNTPAQTPYLWLWLSLVLFFILFPLTQLLKPLWQLELWWRLAADADFWLALQNTLLFCALALPCSAILALVSTLFHPALATTLWMSPEAHTPSAWQRLPRYGLSLLRSLQFMPWLVSASVLALALLIAWSQYLAQLWFFIACYTLIAWPLQVRALDLACAQWRPQLAQVARSHGANAWQTWRHGCWPQLRPALQQGSALAAATILGEFALNLFLARPEWLTLSSYIYYKIGRPGRLPQELALAAACVLTLLALLSYYALLPRKKHFPH